MWLVIARLTSISLPREAFARAERSLPQRALMKLRVSSRLEYAFPQPCEMILQIEVAHRPGVAILSEHFETTPHAAVVRRDDEHGGERRVVMDAAGEVVFDYVAEVDLVPVENRVGHLAANRIADLPASTLPFLRQSAYCPSDRYERFVERQFGGLEGGKLAAAVINWIRAELKYRHGTSTGTSTAHDTFFDREGVCRDFAHLAITLLRAGGLPARMVSAYAWKLSPPDFHAVIEVFLQGQWRLLDPTGLAPVEGLVPIASGRDAADVAFMTIYGEARMISQSVTVEEI